MTDAKEIAEIEMSPQQRQEWIDMVSEVAAELEMHSPPDVEFDCTPKMKGAASYDANTDVVTIFGGWVAVQPDPHSLASRSLIAHELGHRLDRDRLRRHQMTIKAGIVVVALAMASAFVYAFVQAIADSGRYGGPAMPTWVGWLPLTAFALIIVLSAAVRWPDEYRADATAASVYGGRGVHAYLDVFTEHTDNRFRSWPSHSHPSPRMRRARYPR